MIIIQQRQQHLMSIRIIIVNLIENDNNDGLEIYL